MQTSNGAVRAPEGRLATPDPGNNIAGVVEGASPVSGTATTEWISGRSRFGTLNRDGDRAQRGEGEDRRMASGDNLENAEQAVTAGAVSRRFLVRRTVALAVSAPLVLTLLQACGGEDEQEAGGGEGGAADEEATETTSGGGTTSTTSQAASPAASPSGAAASPVGAASPAAGAAASPAAGGAASPAAAGGAASPAAAGAAASPAASPAAVAATPAA
ncbi:MAG: hypothetical protein AVDCRST_MAG19-1623 [uncultured Thermomicrobiales bacterium]|uniref:Uncharacterized protein n=1 Tax=uncultured Thermomicrobiales bacterium TaxID=1645740 RepID=A0A6J4U667_9BACT|nr:MAG: hypothetical protein AVDCRST_MAG19-1623 [uncultured Thermomicrobiales bacterium]